MWLEDLYSWENGWIPKSNNPYFKLLSFGLPIGGIENRKGDKVYVHIVPFKTPLDKKYNDYINPDKWLTTSMLINHYIKSNIHIKCNSFHS